MFTIDTIRTCVNEVNHVLISVVICLLDIQLRKPSTWDTEKIRSYSCSTMIHCVHQYSMSHFSLLSFLPRLFSWFVYINVYGCWSYLYSMALYTLCMFMRIWLIVSLFLVVL